MTQKTQSTPHNPAQPSHRILMIAPTSFFSDYGCHVRILEEARALQKLGQDVTIVTYYKGRNLPDLKIVRTRPVPWRAEYEVGSSRHKIGFDVLLSWTSLKLILRQRFDLVHAHLHEGALIGWMLSKLQRIPLLFDFQGSLTGEMVDHKFLDPGGPWYRPLRRLEKWIDHRPRAIITSSHHAGELVLREFDCHPDRVYPLPDAVNLDFFRPDVLSPVQRAEWKTALGIPARRPVLIYLGVLAEYQGTRKLLEAASILRDRNADVHFLIMGYPAVAYYRDVAQAMGLAGHVTFLGRVPYEQAPRHLALGDVAAAPKMSATEGSGKILNYMAMELPTVAFDTPVSREYLGELGVYAKFGDSASLADAIQSLLAEPERAKALGQRSRRWVAEHFSWDQAGQQLLSIYKRLIQPAKQPQPHPLLSGASDTPGLVTSGNDGPSRPNRQ